LLVDETPVIEKAVLAEKKVNEKPPTSKPVTKPQVPSSKAESRIPKVIPAKPAL
jgi:hypothetical protein